MLGLTLLCPAGPPGSLQLQGLQIPCRATQGGNTCSPLETWAGDTLTIGRLLSSHFSTDVCRISSAMSKCVVLEPLTQDLPLGEPKLAGSKSNILSSSDDNFRGRGSVLSFPMFQLATFQACEK